MRRMSPARVFAWLTALVLGSGFGLASPAARAQGVRPWGIELQAGGATGFRYEEAGARFSTPGGTFGFGSRLKLAVARRLAHGVSIQAETGLLPYLNPPEMHLAVVSDFSVWSSLRDVLFMPLTAGVRYTMAPARSGGFYAEALAGAYWSRWGMDRTSNADPASYSLLVPGAILGLGATSNLDRPTAMLIEFQWLLAAPSGWHSLGAYGNQKFDGMNALSITAGVAIHV